MDVGLRALEVIHDLLKIDEEWTARSPRGFTWLGYRLAQTVKAGTEVEDRGGRACRIVGAVRVVEDVQAPEDEVRALIGALNTSAVGSALAFRTEERAVEGVLAMVVDEGTVEWRAKEIGANLIIMLAFLERAAEKLAEMVRGRVASRTGPGDLARESPDEMLGIIGNVFRPAGLLPSRFESEEDFKAVERLLDGGPFFTAGASATGIAVEVPFGADDTSMIQLVADAPHPQLGNGLGAFTVFPLGGSGLEAAEAAASLNYAQLWHSGLPPALGAWCVKSIGERPLLAHAQFIPNALYSPTRIVDTAMCAIARATWVDEVLHPDLSPRSAVDVVARRLAEFG